MQAARRFALRFIYPHLAAVPAARERFVAEAYVGRRLSHPSLTTHSRYLVAYDRWGVFVVEPSPDRPFPWTGVTYLRFGAYPREVAERLLVAA